MRTSFLRIERITDMQGQELHPGTISFPPTLAEAFQWGQDAFYDHFGDDLDRELSERAKDQDIADLFLLEIRGYLQEVIESSRKPRGHQTCPDPACLAGWVGGLVHAYLAAMQEEEAAQQANVR